MGRYRYRGSCATWFGPCWPTARVGPTCSCRKTPCRRATRVSAANVGKISAFSLLARGRRTIDGQRSRRRVSCSGVSVPQSCGECSCGARARSTAETGETAVRPSTRTCHRGGARALGIPRARHAAARSRFGGIDDLFSRRAGTRQCRTKYVRKPYVVYRTRSTTTTEAFNRFFRVTKAPTYTNTLFFGEDRAYAG